MAISNAAQQALDYLAQYPELLQLVHQTEKVAGFRLKGIHPLALMLENQTITVFVRHGDWLDDAKLPGFKRKDYLPSEPRHSNLKSTTPELSQGHAATSLVLSDLADFQTLCHVYAGRCSLYVLGLIYTCSKFAGLRCPLWIPTVFLNCFAPLPN